MSKYKYRQLHLQKLLVDKKQYEYYENTLISLGLSKSYILYNNYYFFGTNDLDNQSVILEKLENVKKIYEKFLEKIYKKYSCTTLILELGTIYTKLQKIHLCNDALLNNEICNEEIIKDISYPAKMADIMARKVKSLIESVLKKDNKKIDFGLSNRDYRKIVILLYYYSIFRFYNSKTNLSKKYENGITYFQIYPNSLEPICTYIKDQLNSTNENKLYYNYNPGFGEKINENFNKAFLSEKGISYEDNSNLLQHLINNLKIKKMTNGKIEKNEFLSILKENYPTINLKKFEEKCILDKNLFEVDDKDLYKNNSRYRLDTTPLILMDNKYILLNEGLLWNSRNFWNNVHSIGLTPYNLKNDKKDKILNALEEIVKNISNSLESDVQKILKKIYKNIIIHHNKRSYDIFRKFKIKDNEWDIIAVEHNYKIIFDIEVKFLSTSMTESGLANDNKKLELYVKKFQERIKIEKNNMKEFLSFLKANDTYKIVRIMVTSKVVDLNIEDSTREFLVVHYEGLEKYLKTIQKNNFI